MAMRYGAITSRCGTQREIGGMSVAGDQGEAREAWQEVGKRDGRVWQRQGRESRGKKRART